MESLLKAGINLKALEYNVDYVKHLVNNTKILAVVKANAYGHGLVEVAKALEKKVTALGVARLEEALLLRQHGIKKNIVVLSELWDQERFTEALLLECVPVLHNLADVLLLEKSAKYNSRIWLEVDSGMARLGLPLSQLAEAIEKLSTLITDNKLVILSHMVDAEAPHAAINQQQIKLFEKVTLATQCQRSLANSATIINFPNTLYDWVRPGILLYGINPTDKIDINKSLQAVMTLTATLLSVRKIAKGESVGYHGGWCSPCNTFIGTVSIGYADGYPRHAVSGTPVLVNKKIATVAGIVSMDTMCINLGPTTDAKPGDTVTLWGNGLPIETVAKHCNTLPYELLSNLGRRVNYHYHT